MTRTSAGARPVRQARATYAFRLVATRTPRPDEVARIVASYAQQLERFRKDAGAAARGRSRVRGRRHRRRGTSGVDARRQRAAESRRSHHQGMKMDPNILRAITRRHFFKQSGFGIGGVALSALLDDRLFAQQPGAPFARARRISRRRPRTSSICSWRARRRSSICSTTSRRCRSSTGRRSRRSSSRKASGSRSSRERRAARIAVHVQAVRPVGRRAVGAAAAPGDDRGRHRHRALAAHDAVQPRARRRSS